MASAKSRRYGQGGMKHKGTRQEGRPNGKSFKQYPKGFSETTHSLKTVTRELAGTKGLY